MAFAAIGGSAHAAGIGVRAGTTGLGADFGWAIAPTLGGRIGLSGMNFNTDVETDAVNYDAKVKLANLNLLLDWSPLGPFRISAGFIANNNKVDLTGQSTVGGGPIPAGSTLNGTVKPEKDFAPYLGVGYGNVWTAGVNFYFDLGVMFQGSPEVTLNCSGPGCAAAASQIEAERQRIQDKLDKYKYFPVLNIGITIGF
ncbi:MAG TPA: hypothetical protein VFB93_20175 [Burkholderiales bacterium]|nr:hypothetical protein [Burkholderiales bacterium]